jgi:hypothetical protein
MASRKNLVKSVPPIKKGKRISIPLIMTIIRDCGFKERKDLKSAWE